MSDDRRTRTLQRVPLFARLPRRVVERVAEVAAEVEVPAGQVVIEANQAGAGMFVIESGTALVHARDGRHELGPGDVVGEIALFAPDGRRNARVQATTTLRCLAVDRGAFRDLLAEEPELAVGILEVMAERLAR